MDLAKVEQFWDDHSNPSHEINGTTPPGNCHLQYDRNLNFATAAVDDNDYGFPKKKTVRDPLSHRIIEKRRRDRMNNCLADLARLLPPASLRKGRGRIEKTEIVELAIKHLRHLQCHPCPHSDNCEYSPNAKKRAGSTTTDIPPSSSSGATCQIERTHLEEQYRLGFQECLSETMHFLVERESMYSGDPMCVRLVKHLNAHFETLLANDSWTKSKETLGYTATTADKEGNVDTESDFKKESCSLESGSSGYQGYGSSSGSEANGGQEGESTFPEQHSHTGTSTSQVDKAESIYEYDVDNNSCSSTPLSIEISEPVSSDGKCITGGGKHGKPPIPVIICSNSSNNSGSPINRPGEDWTHSSSSAAAAASRYKFKSNIKQRFNADLQTKQDPLSNEDVLENPNEPNTRIIHKFKNRKDVQSGHSNSPNEDEETEKQSESPHTSHSNTPRVPVDTLVVPGTATLAMLGHQLLSTAAESKEMKPTPKELMTHLTSKQVSKTINNSLSHRDGVPAFALHETGLYYVPITIDQAAISPCMNAMNANTQPPLHPITISVCFFVSPVEKQMSYEHSLSNTPANLHAPPHHRTSSSACITKLPNNDTSDFLLSKFTQSHVPPAMFAATSPIPFTIHGPNFTNHGSSSGASSSSLSLKKSGNSSISSNQNQSRYGRGQLHSYHHYYSSSGSTCSDNTSNGEGSLSIFSTSSDGTRSSTRTNSSSSNVNQHHHHHHAGRKRSVTSSSSGSPSNNSSSIGYHSWKDKSISSMNSVDDTLAYSMLTNGSLVHGIPPFVPTIDEYKQRNHNQSSQYPQSQDINHHIIHRNSLSLIFSVQ